jgi:uncharacterized protein YkwD
MKAELLSGVTTGMNITFFFDRTRGLMPRVSRTVRGAKVFSWGLLGGSLMRLPVSIILAFLLLQCSCHTITYKNPGRTVKDFGITNNILKYVNDARAQGRMCGNKYYEAARPVVWNNKLAEASLQHSLDMAENGFLSHTGSNGDSLSERLLSVHYDWTACGENIGHGYRSSEEAVRSWLKSDMHCKNIMSPDFKEIGAAYAKSETLRTYWTIVFGNPIR